MMCLFCNKTDFSVLLFDFRVNCKKILNLLDKLYTYIYIYMQIFQHRSKDYIIAFVHIYIMYATTKYYLRRINIS